MQGAGLKGVGRWQEGTWKPCSGSEASSYLRLIDSCITQLKAQGPSRTCNESKEEEGHLEAVRASCLLDYEKVPHFELSGQDMAN